MSSTHFGFELVDESRQGAALGRGVHPSRLRYDLMNDLMSMGLHRVWKAYTFQVALVRPAFQVLDIAGGTGDMAKAFAKRAAPPGYVWAH